MTFQNIVLILFMGLNARAYSDDSNEHVHGVMFASAFPSICIAIATIQLQFTISSTSKWNCKQTYIYPTCLNF